MPTPDQARYAAAMKRITDRYTHLEDATIKGAIGMLQDLRRQIAAEILTAEGWHTYRLPELQTGIGRAIDQFQSQLSAQARDQFGDAYELGARGVVEPLSAVGLPAFYTPNTAQVNVIKDFSADLIQQIAEPMRAQINTQIRLAALGERSPFQAMQQVTGILGVKARDLRWGRLKRPEVVRGVAARAEAILRTELTRAYNMAHHSQQQATAETIPDVRKSWVATPDGRTRISHINAHIRYADNPIPIDQAFEVGASKLMYPGDPAGPAEETINCRCRTITVHPIVGRPDLPVDIAVEEEKAQREEAARAKRPPRRQPSDFEKEVSGEIKAVQAAHQAALNAGNADEAEGIKGYLDTLNEMHRDERDANEALWQYAQKNPADASAADWQMVSTALRAEGYDLYRKYSKEGIELAVMEKRAAKMDGYADVGGRVVQVQRGRFSVRKAQEIKGRMWQQAKDDLGSAYGELLKKVGYQARDIKDASFAQRRRLVEELGKKEMLMTESGRVSRIDDVSEEIRTKVVKQIDYDAASICEFAAMDPLNIPTIDAYRKMQLADVIDSTRVP
jgi:hypothetical protein